MEVQQESGGKPVTSSREPVLLVGTRRAPVKPAPAANTALDERQANAQTALLETRSHLATQIERIDSILSDLGTDAKR